MDKTQTQLELKKLVRKFQSNQNFYESSDYLERQLQTDFLDDFFKVLGWDITNKANLSPRQREVLVEKGDTKGRPDYTFRVNGSDKFFVEAKSPYRGIDKPDDIFQAKSYGYSTKSVNIAILTDFKSLKVFDSGIKPNIKQPKLGLLFETNLEKMVEEDFERV
ncbi:type I restriction enzyme HsdR N-terminal domain-containing protein, partial [Candidatus Bathyarchaeota archaeon]|nr:type I restriction enzyme HsdR N-terminal domain-containing protein [Candidatus Bathyarchaeota archaeon]